MRASERSRRHALDDRDLDEADREHLRRRSGNAEQDHSAGPDDLAAGLPPDLGRVLHLQRTAGNAAVADLLTVSRDDDDRMPAELAPFRSTAAIAPRDEAPTAGATRRYNERVRRGRAVDQESASGVLPFTPPAGWNGELIAGRLSQLSIAVPQTDAVECVEVSFLVGLVLSGPAAVRASIARYLTTYQDMLGTRGLPRSVRRRLTYGSAHLEDALRGIDEMTLTYADLAQLATAMFTVHARYNPGRGTTGAEEAQMAEDEGFTGVGVGVMSASRATVAGLAALLAPGEYLSCRIDANEPGTGDTNHAVRIGRNRRGQLYFYDPWPRHGSQYQIVDDDLDAIGDYFTTTLRGQPAARRWDVIARWTPPAD